MHNETITSEAYVADILGIPSMLKVESIVAVGYPDEIKPFTKKRNYNMKKYITTIMGNFTKAQVKQGISAGKQEAFKILNKIPAILTQRCRLRLGRYES